MFCYGKPRPVIHNSQLCLENIFSLAQHKPSPNSDSPRHPQTINDFFPPSPTKGWEGSILHIGKPLSSANSLYKEHQVLAMGFKCATIQRAFSVIGRFAVGLWIF
ncbi:hypothetical protein CEXT_269681 [Caerostris extrusa]|uniref:Uncharacterized protein n=1 Tax=Caerostris extrusa TaxID=172846 RepID=A0AAV4Y0Y7_CAEEX|nr:hypothetical protein CEXT_269681 [Caerostris extrusa]